MKARDLSDSDLFTLCRLFARGWHLEYSPVMACWRLTRPARRWSTSLYRTLPLAIAAAEKLQNGADATMAAKERLCAELRVAFGGTSQ